MNKDKFRRICMESSAHKWANISKTVFPQMLVLAIGLLDVVLSKYPNKSHTIKNLTLRRDHFRTIFSENVMRSLNITHGCELINCPEGSTFHQHESQKLP